MNKKAGLLSLTLLSLISLVSCGEKPKREAPTLLSIYQDFEGNVLLAHSALHSSYYPEFSFDGVNWMQSQVKGHNIISILSYYENAFHYRNQNNEDLTLNSKEINVCIREVETAEFGASNPSNYLNIKLKLPQQNVFISSETPVLGLEHLTGAGFSEEDLALLSHNCTAYNLGTEKYSFAVQTYKNLQKDQQTGQYSCDIETKSDSSLLEKMDFVFIDPDKYSFSTIEQEINEDALAGEVTYENIEGDFEIKEELFSDDIIDDKVCALVGYRLKGTDDLLPSKTSVAYFEQFSNSYSASFAPVPGAQFNLSQEETKVTFTLNDDTQVITLDDIKNCVYLTKISNYHSFTNPMNQIDTFDLVMEEGKKTQLDKSDKLKSIDYQIIVEDEVVIEGVFKIKIA